MKSARFWTRATVESPVHAVARGWSNESLEAARAKALEIARRVAERIGSGADKQARYPYGDRPIPEPVIREFTGAVVTRNLYGALVLNTDEMMFVDIDRKAAPAKSGLLSSLFGKPKPAPAQDPVINELADVTARHNLGARIYETAAGYRLIVTSARFKPGSAEAEALLGEYKSDPLYIRLCRMQECFRARLTPKPWRCDYTKPWIEFPFETSEAQEQARQWQSEYDAATASFATCRFITQIGPGSAEFKELIDFHDQETKAQRVHPLA